MSVTINDQALSEVWTEIRAEMTRAESLHPNYPSDHLRRTAIMVEEAGEAIRAALQVTRVGSPVHGYASLEDLRQELVQTAAMCVRQLKVMAEERYEMNRLYDEARSRLVK